MKHVLIACVVFALCLAVGLFSLFYVRASGAQTNELLERSIRQAETEDYTGAAASLRQAKAGLGGTRADPRDLSAPRGGR